MQDHLAALGYDPGPVDGILGARTYAAVARWSVEREPEWEPDGATIPADVPPLIAQDRADLPRPELAAAPSLPAGVHSGTATARALREPAKWAERASSCGFASVIITGNRIHATVAGKRRRVFQPIGSVAKVAAFARAARNEGLVVDLMVYPHPRDLAPLEEWLTGALADVAPQRLWLDLEENWDGRNVDWDAAAHELAHAVDRARGQLQLEVVVTGITYLPRKRLEPVIDWCDIVAPQAMSTNKVGPDRDGDGVPDWKSLAPVKAQQLAARRWKAYTDAGKRLMMVLAAYGQDSTPYGELRACYDAAGAVGAGEVSYWDLRAAWREREAMRRVLR